jgi:hypothetical protein
MMSVVSSREKSPSARCELRDTIGVEFWMMVFFSAQQGIDKCFNLKLSRFLNDDVHNWKDWNIGRGWHHCSRLTRFPSFTLDVQSLISSVMGFEHMFSTTIKIRRMTVDS